MLKEPLQPRGTTSELPGDRSRGMAAFFRDAIGHRIVGHVARRLRVAIRRPVGPQSRNSVVGHRVVSMVQVSQKRTGLPVGVSQISPSRMAKCPRITVARGQPVTVMPS